MTQNLFQAIGQNNLKGIIREFLAHRDPQKFARSVEEYQRFVERVRRQGYRLLCVTFPMVLDDLEDGDTDLQDFLNLPVTPIPWDELSFMVYRTTAYDLGITGATSYLVYSYARSAHALYGEQAGIDIGLVAPPDSTRATPDGLQGYNDPQPLLMDLRAALAAGVRKIHIWPLDHLILYSDLGSWITYPLDSSDWLPPPGDRSTEGLRVGIRLLDEALGENP